MTKSLTFTYDLVTGGSSVPQLVDDGTSAYIYGASTTPIEQINLASSSPSYLSSVPSGVQAVFSASGSLVEQAAYGTYGTQTIQTGSIATPFGFQDAYSDPSGLSYLVNRYYTPATAQFLSVDPMLTATGQPYAMEGDNPLNNTDPLGLRWVGMGCLRHCHHRGSRWRSRRATELALSPALTATKSGEAQFLEETLTITASTSVRGTAAKPSLAINPATGNVTMSADGTQVTLPTAELAAPGASSPTGSVTITAAGTAGWAFGPTVDITKSGSTSRFDYTLTVAVTTQTLPMLPPPPVPLETAPDLIAQLCEANPFACGETVLAFS